MKISPVSILYALIFFFFYILIGTLTCKAFEMQMQGTYHLSQSKSYPCVFDVYSDNDNEVISFDMTYNNGICFPILYKMGEVLFPIDNTSISRTDSIFSLTNFITGDNLIFSLGSAYNNKRSQSNSFDMDDLFFLLEYAGYSQVNNEVSPKDEKYCKELYNGINIYFDSDVDYFEPFEILNIKTSFNSTNPKDTFKKLCDGIEELFPLNYTVDESLLGFVNNPLGIVTTKGWDIRFSELTNIANQLFKDYIKEKTSDSQWFRTDRNDHEVGLLIHDYAIRNFNGVDYTRLLIRPAYKESDVAREKDWLNGCSIYSEELYTPKKANNKVENSLYKRTQSFKEKCIWDDSKILKYCLNIVLLLKDNGWKFVQSKRKNTCKWHKAEYSSKQLELHFEGSKDGKTVTIKSTLDSYKEYYQIQLSVDNEWAGYQTIK